MSSLELEARLDNLLSTAQDETKDIDLFAPIVEREECPICMIPLPIKDNEVVFMPCVERVYALVVPIKEWRQIRNVPSVGSRLPGSKH